MLPIAFLLMLFILLISNNAAANDTSNVDIAADTATALSMLSIWHMTPMTPDRAITTPVNAKTPAILFLSDSSFPIATIIVAIPSMATVSASVEFLSLSPSINDNPATASANTPIATVSDMMVPFFTFAAYCDTYTSPPNNVSNIETTRVALGNASGSI